MLYYSTVTHCWFPLKKYVIHQIVSRNDFTIQSLQYRQININRRNIVNYNQIRFTHILQNTQIMDTYTKIKTMMFLPNSTFIVAWSIAFSMSVIFYFSLSLMALAFQMYSTIEFFNTFIVTIVMIGICIIDTFISLRLCSIENGKLISDKYDNLRKYRKSPLLYTDLIVITVLFIKFILEAIVDDSDILMLFDMVILIKFYNINLYQKKLKLYYFRQRNLLIFQFCKYMVVLGFLCHIVGCLYFYIDALLIQIGWYPIQDHWLITSSAMNGLYYEPIGIQYLYSFYVSIVTLSTIAYGDITPMNPTEASFILFVQAFLLLFYAYIFTQIYEVVTFFNREQIRIREDKIKMVHYLNKHQSWIASQLKGRIIAEYEYRNRTENKSKKELFFDCLNKRLKSKYNRADFKLTTEHFIPGFLMRATISNQQFNSIISEEFHVDDQPFYALKKSLYQDQEKWSDRRKMYYVGDIKILRYLKLGGGQFLCEQAQPYRWVGLNYFITGQIDFNESWHVEYPVQILSVQFSKLKSLLKKQFISYEKYLEEAHQLLFWGGTAQDMQKCLICGKQYHSSLYCQEYRPKISYLKFSQKNVNKRNKNYLRTSTPFNKKQLLVQKRNPKILTQQSGAQININDELQLGMITQQRKKHYFVERLENSDQQMEYEEVKLITFTKNEHPIQTSHRRLHIEPRRDSMLIPTRGSFLMARKSSQFHKSYLSSTIRRSWMVSTKKYSSQKKYLKWQKETQRIGLIKNMIETDKLWNWAIYMHCHNINKG